MKRILSVLLALAMMLSFFTLSADAKDSNACIYVDLASLGWRNASEVLVDVTDYELEKVMGPSLMHTSVQTKEGEALLRIDMNEAFSSMTEGHPCRIVMTEYATQTKTYPLMIDRSCTGDTIKANGSIVRRSWGSLPEYMVYWEHQDTITNGPAVFIAKDGAVYGECFPYPAYDMLLSYINDNIDSFNGCTDEEIQMKIISTALDLGLLRVDALKAIRESDLQIELSDPPEFDDTPEGQFKHFLYYELEEARKSGKSDQDLLDERAIELDLTPYQVYVYLEDLSMRNKVSWDFKLWLNNSPAYKGELFSFGLYGFMPDIPGEITGTVTYNTKGVRLYEGLKQYPVSGLRFPLATEEYGRLYDVDYTFSDGRVDFRYVLKDKKAAEEFFDIHTSSTADEAEKVRIRLTFVIGMQELIADTGRYNSADVNVEIKDTKGNYLYKDHQASQSGYGVQGEFPRLQKPLPEEYIGYVPEYLLGDADKDGVITILDATTIQKYKATLLSKSKIDLLAADVDKDGVVTVIDATRIQKYKAKLHSLDGSGPYYDWD